MGVYYSPRRQARIRNDDFRAGAVSQMLPDREAFIDANKHIEPDHNPKDYFVQAKEEMKKNLYLNP